MARAKLPLLQIAIPAAAVGAFLAIRLLSADPLVACGLIILVASAGKFGGTALAAMATGLGRRQAMALGILMNTRGLMELIVLNVGLELGVLSPTLFSL